MAVYSNTRYLEALLKELGPMVKDEDDTKELETPKAKVYKESVGRLLCLGHSRPDIQYSVCVLSGKMANGQGLQVAAESCGVLGCGP